PRTARPAPVRPGPPQLGSAAAPSRPLAPAVSAGPSPPTPPAPKAGEATRAAPHMPPAPERKEGVRDARPNRVFSSPLARRLAREAGIDLARVQGSGPHGRVIARDVEATKSGRGIMPPAAT